MPTRTVIDGNGNSVTETFEYTAEELAALAEQRQVHIDERDARAAERAALTTNLADLQANENSMPALKAKVNYLLEQVRLLKGL